MAREWLKALPVVVAASAATVAAGNGAAAQNAAPVACHVEALTTAGGVTLRAVATARRPVAGAYLFSVDKRGSGGRASSSQGGEFSVGRGGKEVLADVALGLERDARYTARLTLTWPGGEAACEAKDRPI